MLSQKRHGIKFFCFHLLFTPDGFAQSEYIIECLLKDQKNQSHYLNIRWMTQVISGILRITKPQKRKTYQKKKKCHSLFFHFGTNIQVIELKHFVLLILWNKCRFWRLQMFLHCFLTCLLFFTYSISTSDIFIALSYFEKERSWVAVLLKTRLRWTTLTKYGNLSIIWFALVSSNTEVFCKCTLLVTRWNLTNRNLYKPNIFC